MLDSLLGSCSVHRKLELGERLMQKLVQMYPQNTEYHVLLSNMYAQSGKFETADSLQKVLKTQGIRKVLGISYIHIGGQVYHFSAGDKSHPHTEEIYLMLDKMIKKLRLAGYVPNTASQIFSGGDGGKDDADGEEEKERALFSHSEKLEPVVTRPLSLSSNRIAEKEDIKKSKDGLSSCLAFKFNHQPVVTRPPSLSSNRIAKKEDIKKSKDGLSSCLSALTHLKEGQVFTGFAGPYEAKRLEKTQNNH
ncbi:DYW family of nucleic acid deaminase domain-containing protein [Forsythia ovata]|uniref:DYW family of nucleic acid deaminase domain-containing protein n=1 Tax=Forsythia ovata TaxID=205694 RepID=A0ABD1WRI8_9LAMI